MMKEFKSEISYNQEVDKHFPHLTVGQTLEFAALARAPHRRLDGISREEYARRLRDIMMAVFGLSHTVNTKVGDDFVRGVSGGERKRVSIAEMAISRSPIALWDNSTRGLDAATAFEFVNALRTVSDLVGMCHAVAAYQASQAIYDLFDKAIVLYEGREIYFGPTSTAKQYFEDMGWFCHPRQTTGDFLTSVTNPQERKPRDGYEGKIPRTPDEFQRHWKTSPQFAALQEEIEKHEEEFPLGGEFVSQFQESHRAQQAKHVRPDSKYIISIPMQVKLNTRRAYQRLWNNKLPTITQVIGRMFMALIVGSIYYGSANNTDVLFSRGSTLFYAVLLNALLAITEIGTLYSQRPIVEKQKSYAFYHPFSEALAGFIADLPVKFVAATLFNVVFYFLSGLRYDAKSFFTYFLFVWISMLTMSFIYRTIAASTKAISQAMALAGIMTLSIGMRSAL
jgi:ATP-binding cassette, subfamily G (WHITE), member 2, PDR